MFYLCFGTLFMHFPELTYWQDATVPVPVSAVFGFRKVTQEIFSELDVTKANVPIFTVPKQRTEDETKKGSRVATPTLGAA